MAHLTFTPSSSTSSSQAPSSQDVQARRPRGRRLMRGTLLAGFLSAGLALALGTAPAALAHDELVSTIPTAGERLDAAPSELELSFSSPLMDLGNQILVLDADGRDWAETDPVLNRETLVQSLPDSMPTGEYSVRWRAVSSDGHPINGSYEFLVGADAVAGTAVTALPAEAADSATDNESAATESPETETAATETSDDGGLPAWLIPGIIGGVVGLLIYAVYTAVSRRRGSRTE